MQFIGKLIPLFLLLFSSCTPQEHSEQPPFDLLIINGTVYDGSLGAGQQVNIGIYDDRIASVDAPANAPATVVIDATNLAVVPGFIDPHTHALDDLLSLNRNRNDNYLTQGVTTVFVGNDGGGVPQRAERVPMMRSQGTGTNVAFFAGHNDIRTTVMGLENRAPTMDELSQMKALVEEEMRIGALGLSTGLFYRPGSYANTDEIIELAKVAASFGGVYDSHMRDESSYNLGLLGSVKEVLQIGQEADIPVHIAHLKALGRDVWGQSGDIIGLVDTARANGVQVTADQYPWQASGTRFGSAVIPRWVMADSQEAMFARLANPDLQQDIHTEMEGNIWRRGGTDSMLVTGESRWRGMTLSDIAEQMQVEPVEAVIEVVREGDPSIASFNMTTDDIEAIAIQEWVMTGSDGSSGHPRKYASYPKAYRDFVVDRKLLSMPQFVHRSAGLVADTFSLCDRGYLEVGRKADIGLLDLETYLPEADFEDPTRLGTGLVHLLVNGAIVIEDRNIKNVLPGEVINRQQLDCPSQ